jgi:hypothetical protein
MEEQRNFNLCVNLAYDEEKDMFIISYFEEERALFQIGMVPEAFERMVGDMVKVIKNYNLEKANRYLESKKNEEQKTIETDESTAGNSISDPSNENQRDQTQSE